MNQRIEVIKTAALKAGEEILKFDHDAMDIVSKSSISDFVTAADLASEKIVFETIHASFPNEIIISEEKEENHDLLTNDKLADFTGWVTDPLDGTNNFKRGAKNSAVSIGYVENGIPVIGAVFDPFKNELYLAEKGKGVTRNGKEIKLSGITEFNGNTRVCTANSYQNRVEESLSKIFKLGHVWVDVQGAAVLIMTDVAAGRMDLMYHSSLHPWDNTAAFLIAEEAGAKITDLQGNPINWLSAEVVLGNPKLVDEFVRLTN